MPIPVFLSLKNNFMKLIKKSVGLLIIHSKKTTGTQINKLIK